MPPIAASSGRPLPVILDTDLGDDIDDTWALAMLLRSPELDPRLIITAFRNTRARAQIVAKLLHIAGRADIPIGVGVPTADTPLPPQAPWAADYDLASYPGPVHADGVGALRSATKSAMVKSTSCPTAEITGIFESNIALATHSSLNAQRSSSDPPPLPTISTSIPLMVFRYLIPSAIS